MAKIRFTDNIQRHVACPADVAPGSTVREVLDAYFTAHDGIRHYVLDEQGELRRHMMIFVDGETIIDRRQLSDPVAQASVVDVMQALSGG